MKFPHIPRHKIPNYRTLVDHVERIGKVALWWSIAYMCFQLARAIGS
jgi:hypothetical protein